MSKEIVTKNRVRKYFGKIREVAEMPNLIEVQKSSYEYSSTLEREVSL